MTSFTADCESKGAGLPVCADIDPARLNIDVLQSDSSNVITADGQDVIDGLTHTPKSLPPKYFYDRLGSELFEKICALPEYYPTRTESTIFHTYAHEITRLTGACELVELGSGSATKTRILLDAYQANELPLYYLPVDVSGTMLKASAEQLLCEYLSLSIHGMIGTYDPALRALPTVQLATRMVMFIGSTLGNLSPEQCDRFLQQVSNALDSGQFFLLGIDLQKDIATVEAAYNDAQGVTAMFNLNMLRHLNYRYGGDFCLEQFRHEAIYNSTDHQIEMYLESQQDQTVTLKALDLKAQFAQGERLRSEISRKFNPTDMAQQLDSHGLKVLKTFTDEREWFGLILAQKV
ncbi:MAG: L-histidine N(alpha)-methyltransferase [Leptolyngbya sp. SIO3F4]|nr:L-histidine N(alpha)-methyltransferase [Leptolyngbya sp. SIO3F4]